MQAAPSIFQHFPQPATTIKKGYEWFYYESLRWCQVKIDQSSLPPKMLRACSGPCNFGPSPTWQLSNWSVSLVKGGSVAGHTKRDTSPTDSLVWKTEWSSFRGYLKSLLERFAAVLLGELRRELRSKSWMARKGAEGKKASWCRWDLQHEGQSWLHWKLKRPPLRWQKTGLGQLIKRPVGHLDACLGGRRAASDPLATR